MHIYNRKHILKKQVLTLFHCIYVYFPLPTILITGFDLIVQPIMYRVLSSYPSLGKFVQVANTC